MVEVGLSIAEQGVVLSIPEPTLAALLRQRYHAFPLYAAPTLRVAVRSHEARATSSHDTEVRLHTQDMTVVLQAVGWKGGINTATGSGWLELQTATATEAVDYFLRVAYALLMLNCGGILFHAAGLVHNGKAYAFFGHSGSGKTTVARLSTNATVLNDDLVVLMPVAGGWTMWSTPFSNPTQVRPTNPGAVALHALFRLVQAPMVRLEPLSGAHALAEITASCPIVSGTVEYAGTLLERGGALLNAVPVYNLHFRRDATFWQAIHAAEQHDRL